MEGPIQETSDLWLFNFRKSINSSCSPLEFARKAISYDPHYQSREESGSDEGFERKETQQALHTEFKCSGVQVLDVSSVYNLGNQSFVPCSDVRINLYKVYIYLSEAIRRLKNLEQSELSPEHRECMSTLQFLFKRFDEYIKITMRLSEDFKSNQVRHTKKGEGLESTNGQTSTKFMEITSKFKVDQDEMNRLFQVDSDNDGSKDSKDYSSETMTLLWHFYRDASCSDIFALLCYTLFTGNPFCYRIILENFSSCMKSHVRENWKVLLSYVPISFDFKDYTYTFESVLFDQNSGEGRDREGGVDEELLLSFMDWCLWRIFLIIKYTNSSYFLLIRFLKSLFNLLGPFESLPRINQKLQVLNFLKFIIKQYFIYKSFNSGASYKDISSSCRKEENSTTLDYMSFFEYLDLDASKKLSLFCEFDVSSHTTECNCEDQFKDKHKIYKYCVHCKTSNLCNKLRSFFVLINPGTEGLYLEDTEPNSPRGSGPVINGGLSNENRDSLDNEYLPLNADFRDFFSSLLKSYNSGLHDYIGGISETFMKRLNTHSFEILYSLATVLLDTGFRGKVFNIFLNIVYRKNSKYNFLENYFLIKSTFNLISDNTELLNETNNVDTGTTLFKALRYFDPGKGNSDNSYSQFKHLSRQLMSLNKENCQNSNKNEEMGLDVIVNSIRCQLDFTEGLLNLFSLISAESTVLPVVTPVELMTGLVHEEYFLLLLQKILLFIMDLSLAPSEFSNCLLELVNLSNYLSNTSPDTIHSMFFYTIACKNYLNYLDQQLQAWNVTKIAAKESDAPGYEGSYSSDMNVNDSGFLEVSLDCVLNTVRKMDMSCDLNLFHLLVSYCKFVPTNHKFYDKIRSSNALSIYSVISLYLNYTNLNTNVVSSLDSEGNNNGCYLGKFEMLVTLCKVYKCLMLFDSYNFGRAKGEDVLDYKLYSSRELIDRTLSSLISVINTNYLNNEDFDSDDDEENDKNVKKEVGNMSEKVSLMKEKMLLLVFRCILEHVLMNKLYTRELFGNLKVAIGELCPKEVSSTLLKTVDVLSHIHDYSSLENNEYLKMEGKDKALKGVLVNLLFILYVQTYNLLFISKLIGFCVSNHLSSSLGFIYDHFMKSGSGSSQYPFSPELTSDQDRGHRLDSPDGPSEEEKEQNSEDIDIGDLFDYQHQDQCKDLTFGDDEFRRSVVSLLTEKRYERSIVKESIGKLTTKLGHNVASDFITAAIEKAEGELLNIAKKTQKFDMIKDKFFYQKKGQSSDKSMYAPLLNYFEGTPLFPITLGDHEGSQLNELLRYRNLKDTSVSSLVWVDVDLACHLLLENCSHTFGPDFLRDIQDVFNKNDLRKVHKFLESLIPYLEHFEWPSGVVDKVKAVKKFLELFSEFPQDVMVLLSSFVFNREYRLGLFKSIPSFVASNLQLVQDIFKNLLLFHNYTLFMGLTDRPEESIEDLQDYLFGPISGDGNRDLSLETSNSKEFDDMGEYVEVLFSIYEDIFLDDFNIDSFLQLEPLFLMNHDKYLYFLLKLYYNLTFPSKNTTPTSAHSGYSIGSGPSIPFTTPRTPSSSHSNFNLALNNSRLVMVRRFIYNFLVVYPEFKDSFNMLYRADSPDVLKLMEAVLTHVPDFDLSVLDNFELFKKNLISVLTLDNFFFVADSIEKLDPSFCVAVYRKLELKLRPHSSELVDCTRLLFEYDLSNNTL